MYNRKREESVTLVYHPCAKFDRGRNMSESACNQLSVCNHSMHNSIGGHVALMVEWGVDS